jgi:uncharacterized membrane protein
VRPAAIALWGAPTGLAAFAVHAARLMRLDRRLAKAKAAAQALDAA